MIVLDTLADTPSRILSATGPAEVARTVVPALRSHFAGGAASPCMIGDTGGHGGAYGVVGAAGDGRILLLDPHYVGADTEAAVAAARACRWVLPEDFFRAGVWYNFLLPGGATDGPG